MIRPLASKRIFMNCRVTVGGDVHKTRKSNGHYRLTFPNRLELSFLSVLAFPKDSSKGFVFRTRCSSAPTESLVDEVVDPSTVTLFYSTV